MVITPDGRVYEDLPVADKLAVLLKYPRCVMDNITKLAIAEAILELDRLTKEGK